LVMRKLSFALTSLRSQDRRIRPRLSTILNSFSHDGSFEPAVLVMRKLSFALTSLRSQDRRIRPRLSTILNFYARHSLYSVPLKVK
jgi:hypothetical protein